MKPLPCPSPLRGLRPSTWRLCAAGSLLGCALGLPVWANPATPANTPSAALPTQARDLAREGRLPAGVTVRVLVEGLQHPWSMAWLPSGEMLVTERGGQLRRVSRDFKLDPKPIGGVPPVVVKGQGGLFDVVVHPQHARNGWIYLAYNEPEAGGGRKAGTALARARLQGDQLVDVTRLFAMQPKTDTGFHFGGRIVLDGKGHVFLTLGDRGDKERAQQPKDHAGAVIRLTEDGRVPSDNPFIGSSDVPPEVYSRGHRNIQGAALHPRTGELWTHEHGPQGGDELNISRPGRNYGWPTITYGVNYGVGTKIGEGTAKPGLEQPLHLWVPSIAVSGMAFYDGDAYPGWKGSLLIGGLRSQMLVRLELQEGRVVKEERLLTNEHGRIRDVRVGPDGLVYLLTDSPEGRLLRLEPASR